MVLLYGAGGHASVVIDALNERGTSVGGLFDDAMNPGQLRGVPVLGKYSPDNLKDGKLIITIGDNRIRKRLSAAVKHAFDSVVALSTVISPSARIGGGSMVLHKVIMQSHASIGSHVILNTGCQLDHDCLIGDFAHIGPGSILCGHVTVGEGTLVGAGAVIIPGIKIGKWCTIGAGSVVVKDVGDDTVIAGNPAREIKTS